MPGRLFLFSLLLAALALPSPAGADAALVPVPFTEAGFLLPPGEHFSSFEREGLAPIPLAAPVTIVSSAAFCAKTGGGPFPIPSTLACDEQGPIVDLAPDGNIALAAGLFQFNASLVSTPGSRWNVAVVNPTLLIPNPAAVGSTFATPTVVNVRIVIDAFPSASFVVPDATDAPTESIAIRRLPPNSSSVAGLTLVEARSAVLDTSARPFSPALLEPFLDGDTVTVVGRARFEFSFTAFVFAGFVSGVQFERVDPCGRTTSTTGLPDGVCESGLELLAPHAATATASLACRADLTGDGVVNFADLANLRSVFFQRCTP